MVSATGDTVAAWGETDADDAFPIDVMVAVDPAGPEPVVRTKIDTDLSGCAIDIAADGLGNVMVVWQSTDGTIKAVRIGPGGEIGESEVVGSDSSSTPHLAMNADGGAVVMWATFASLPSRIGYRISYSPPGEPFGASQQIGGHLGTGLEGYDVTLGPSADVSAIWAYKPEEADTWVVEAASGTAGESLSGQTLDVGTTERSCPQVVANDQGEVAGLWLGTGCDGGTLLVSRRSPGESFDLPSTLATPVAYDRPALDIDDDGTLVIGYSSPEGGKVVLAPLEESPRVSASVDGSVGDLAVEQAGNGLIAWTKYGFPSSTFTAGRLSSEGAVSPYQEISGVDSWATPIGVDVGPTGQGAALFMRDGNLNLVLDQVAVAPPNTPPVLDPIGPQSVREGSPLQLTVSGSDLDVGDPLSYSASNLPPGASFDPATRTFSWTPGPGSAGTYEVQFAISDGTDSDFEDVSMTVSANGTPVLDPIGSKSVDEETLLEFTVSGSDPDAGDALTYSASNLPPGATFDPATQTFSWAPGPGSAGAYQVQFVVSDGTLNDTEDISVTVSPSSTGLSPAVAAPPPAAPPPAPTRKCKKGRKLKNGKCVKKRATR